MQAPKLSVMSGGLLNATYQVDVPRGRFVLQSLNKIFRPEVNDDIEAITTHLAEKGVPTTRLVRTLDGALCADVDGTCWRVLTFVAGTRTVSRVQDAAMASEAGALVGRFHLAVSDLEHTFKFSRLNVHDTQKHMATLEEAISEHRAHRHFEPVQRLAAEILLAWRQWKAKVPEKKRLVHGDLKISNVLFDERTSRAVCLIDLDTLAYMPLMHELGDAWRSWCNPIGEDATETRFDLGLFRAAANGYMNAARRFVTHEEAESLAHGTALIALELSARFCADALRESYFGWNAAKFADRSTHNRVRAEGQFNLYRSVRAQQADIERILREAYAG
ncbi:MAG: phosphotransferase [Deltaproteobacteria bacterium]|nr:phosphotransferase [Deltaproteobacteria bacterium]